MSVMCEREKERKRENKGERDDSLKRKKSKTIC